MTTANGEVGDLTVEAATCLQLSYVAKYNAVPRVSRAVASSAAAVMERLHVQTRF